MNDPSAVLATLAESPDWFCHQIDPEADRALLVRLEPAAIRAAAFLDERVLAGRSDGFRIPLATLLARAQPMLGQAPQAIFHIGHCGSTLLARVMGELPDMRVLREPLALRTLAALHEELPLATARMDAMQWQVLARAVLGLMARREPGNIGVLVKATSSCNDLIGPWLACDERALAVLLTIGLRDYLATILKSPASRADALRFLPARLAYLHRRLGDDTLRLPTLSVAERIALGWLAERERFAEARQVHRNRVRRLDFDAFLANPTKILGGIVTHMNLPVDLDELEPAFHRARPDRYAKATEHPYDAQARAADLAESERRHAPEMRAGMDFAERVVLRYPSLGPLEQVHHHLY